MKLVVVPRSYLDFFGEQVYHNDSEGREKRSEKDTHISDVYRYVQEVKCVEDGASSHHQPCKQEACIISYIMAGKVQQVSSGRHG